MESPDSTSVCSLGGFVQLTGNLNENSPYLLTSNEFLLKLQLKDSCITTNNSLTSWFADTISDLNIHII